MPDQLVKWNTPVGIYASANGVRLLFKDMKAPELLSAYQALRRRGVNQDDLHDAIVELIPRLPHVKNVLAYLARVTFRKRVKRGPIQLAPCHPRKCPSPEDGLCQQESILSVRHAIEQLPLRERRVVQLYYLNGEACNAIARHLGWTPGAVRSVLFRAQKRLADSLAYTAEDD